MDGEAVLLTGASGCIGAEVARELGARGARLAISARRAGMLEEVAESVARAGGSRPGVLTADLGRRGEAAELSRGAEDGPGAGDGVINNAAGGPPGAAWAA